MSKRYLFQLTRASHPVWVIVMMVAVVCTSAGWAGAQIGTGTFRIDATNGIDSSDCGSAGFPCRSIQQAVNLAETGDALLVAAGTYTYDQGLDISCSQYTGKTAVVCILNLELSLIGGFDGVDWVNSDPNVNPTVIDGGDVWRGVRVADTEPGLAPFAALRIEGLTIRNGFAGFEVGADGVPRSFGGGFESLYSKVEARDLIFEDNAAVGVDTTSGGGGWGLAGGMSIRIPLAGSIVERVVFVRNQARGGFGPDVGGFGIGGGMLVSDPNYEGGLLILADLEFFDNTAIGGNSQGAPTLQDKKADAQGGAIAFQGGSWATVSGLFASGNSAMGGDSRGFGGGAFGGAVFLENAVDVQLQDLDLYDNLAEGGDGADGGLGEGGGLMAANSQFSLERSSVIANISRGGAGSSGNKGAPGGGGLLIQRTSGTTTVMVRNTIVSDNSVEESSVGLTKGGGGGGIFVVGADVGLSHCTISGNRLNANSNQGLGLVLVDGPTETSVVVAYGIIANHTVVQGEAAVHVQAASRITFSNVLFAGNENDTNQGDANSGEFFGLDTLLNVSDAGFVSPGRPDFDYHLIANSPAVDAASGSTEMEDFERQGRDDLPDLGADELGVQFFEDGFESGSTVAWDGTVAG